MKFLTLYDLCLRNQREVFALIDEFNDIGNSSNQDAKKIGLALKAKEKISELMKVIDMADHPNHTQRLDKPGLKRELKAIDAFLGSLVQKSDDFFPSQTRSP